MKEALDDLAAEQDDLDRIVSGLPDEAWETETPARPWRIRDQITHLAFFDDKAALAARDPDGFTAELNRITDVESFLGQHLEMGARLSPTELLGWWREARQGLLDALASRSPDDRLPWYGPPMRAESSAAARLMETWAHGQDVVDALGATRPATDRLFRVADLGVRTFSWSFTVRGLEVPSQKVRVELTGPSGRSRVWNPDEAESVTGDLEEFCLVVTQRRHVDDTRLRTDGPIARRWMEIAQVFAGPPGPGRPPTGG
ncbi:MAG: TIGR03084 family protein [Acidimicrobiia bacterium]|nr:MAG: TIGR03084 family protein [Acidimicrobiia bacterium]